MGFAFRMSGLSCLGFKAPGPLFSGLGKRIKERIQGNKVWVSSSLGFSNQNVGNGCSPLQDLRTPSLGLRTWGAKFREYDLGNKI